MKVLVGCECSGVVREAFRAKGHKAWSCDIKPAEDSSRFHIQGDILEHLEGWDMMVVHPECTYLCRSGLHWNLRRPERAEKTEEALCFVQALLAAPIERIALENPQGCISSRIRKPDQYVQPWMFGDDASKNTGLWLKNLPLLQPTLVVEPRLVAGKKRWANQMDNGQNRLGESKGRSSIRSRTYQGLARAMADQWT